jgi:hypothetical protein
MDTRKSAGRKAKTLRRRKPMRVAAMNRSKLSGHGTDACGEQDLEVARLLHGLASLK